VNAVSICAVYLNIPSKRRRAFWRSAQRLWNTYRELFSFAGCNLDDFVRLIPLAVPYCAHFGDGDCLTIHRTLLALVQEPERIEPSVTPRFLPLADGRCIRPSIVM
jgi:hypothetical protein